MHRGDWPQYLIDMDQWGYTDARLGSESRMNAEEINAWDSAGLTGHPR